jgi:hypothetical protein
MLRIVVIKIVYIVNKCILESILSQFHQFSLRLKCWFRLNIYALFHPVSESVTHDHHR